MENEFNKILGHIISSKRMSRKEGIELIKQQIKKDNIAIKEALQLIDNYMEKINFESIFKNKPKSKELTIIWVD